MNAIIECHDLHKAYGTTPALAGVSLSIDTGEVLAIMGPSGSGKSTLLHCLAGIITPDSGQVIYDGQRIDCLGDDKRSVLRRTAFGFVFQFGQLVPELTALDNVALPLLLGGVKRREGYDRATQWLMRVGLDNDHHHQLPGHLSGGQAQRVTIARAMAVEPAVLFADEPTGALDSLASQQIMELLVGVAQQAQTSIVMVTHEPSIAAYADREVVVRDGRLAGQEVRA